MAWPQNSWEIPRFPDEMVPGQSSRSVQMSSGRTRMEPAGDNRLAGGLSQPVLINIITQSPFGPKQADSPYLSTPSPAYRLRRPLVAGIS